jgi:hypothetical protein
MKDKRIVENLKLREGGQLTADREIILRPKIEDPLKYAGMLGKEEKFRRVKDLIMKYRKKRERHIKNEF